MSLFKTSTDQDVNIEWQANDIYFKKKDYGELRDDIRYKVEPDDKKIT